MPTWGHGQRSNLSPAQESCGDDPGPQCRGSAGTNVAQLDALVTQQGRHGDASLLKVAIGGLRSALPQLRHARIDEIMGILFRALTHAEIHAPTAATGSFIAVGNAFDALRAIADVLREASSEIMIVDPYMAEDALSDAAVLADEGVTIRLLSDAGTVKPGLRPAVTAWIQQYGSTRPLEARLSPAKTLHDRLIFIDCRKVWILTQSLKDLAKRSPASLTASDNETASLKLAAYADIWTNSSPI